MAARTLRCRWCGLLSRVPFEAQSVSCPSCHRITIVQGDYDRQSHSPSGGNLMRVNGYGTNPGYATYNRPHRPVNAGNAYLMQSQTPRPMANINYYQAPPHLRPPVNVYQVSRSMRPPVNGNQVPQQLCSPVNVNQVPQQLRSPVNVNQVPQHLSPPGAYGRKRAVLCGINYKGNKHSLDGSINDVLWMRRLLVGKLGFPNSSVLVLTEDEDDTRIPTKQNIRSALRWLVHSCQPGDSLVFHYSGHGAQVKDRDGDELDGFDESLLPVDYETEGRILDDEINAVIVRPLPHGVTLHAIVDTCFSGTLLDLPNVCRISRQGSYKWEDHHMPHATYRGTSGGFAVSISACDDHQNSGDTTAFTGVPLGALTYCFVQTLEQEPRLTYGRLLMTMRKRIDSVRGQVLNSEASKSSQEPLLSSSNMFDIHSKRFTM